MTNYSLTKRTSKLTLHRAASVNSSKNWSPLPPFHKYELVTQEDRTVPIVDEETQTSLLIHIK